MLTVSCFDLATTGTIGTQERLIHCHAGISVQSILQIEQKQQLDDIRALVKPNLFYNTLGSIHPCSGVEGKSLHNNYIKEQLNKNTNLHFRLYRYLCGRSAGDSLNLT
jgi:hypothetical protein